MQDTFARATHSAYAAGSQARRSTIGYLVYKLITRQEIIFVLCIKYVGLAYFNIPTAHSQNKNNYGGTRNGRNAIAPLALSGDHFHILRLQNVITISNF